MTNKTKCIILCDLIITLKGKSFDQTAIVILGKGDLTVGTVGGRISDLTQAGALERDPNAKPASYRQIVSNDELLKIGAECQSGQHRKPKVVTDVSGLPAMNFDPEFCAMICHPDVKGPAVRQFRKQIATLKKWGFTVDIDVDKAGE